MVAVLSVPSWQIFHNVPLLALAYVNGTLFAGERIYGQGVAQIFSVFRGAINRDVGEPISYSFKDGKFECNPVLTKDQTPIYVLRLLSVPEQVVESLKGVVEHGRQYINTRNIDTFKEKFGT